MKSWVPVISTIAVFFCGFYVGRKTMEAKTIPVDEFTHAMDSMQHRVADLELQKTTQSSTSDSIIRGLAAVIAADTLPVPTKVSHAYHAIRDHAPQQYADSMLPAPPAGSR